MSKNLLLDFHRDKWYNGAGIAFKDVEPHIQYLKHMDKIVPPGPRFYLVVNFSTFHYDYIGRGQSFLSGYDNEVVEKEGVQFQIRNMHPEDGEFIVKHSYPTFSQLLASHSFEDQKKMLLQHNYRFRHREGYYVHLMEQVSVMKADEQGKHQAMLVHVYEMPMVQPFKVKMLINKLSSGQTYETLYTAEFPHENDKMQLSEREKEVIRLLAQGLNSKEIACKLFISYHTVRTHRKNMLQKLEMKSTSELVAYGITHGLV
ncbi:response regulator transcription factor [Nafulsella turpanensis]|uniref:response regulator transcription factor n=1 Tax=Nafulsella turpanensis TaxID=1265690 RepID=UPI000347A429|nr:response regulator transcription factor [Nafulsella turpanensis]